MDDANNILSQIERWCWWSHTYQNLIRKGETDEQIH